MSSPSRVEKHLGCKVRVSGSEFIINITIIIIRVSD